MHAGFAGILKLYDRPRRVVVQRFIVRHDDKHDLLFWASLQVRAQRRRLLAYTVDPATSANKKWGQ
jgi:hypothetical protein